MAISCNNKKKYLQLIKENDYKMAQILNPLGMTTIGSLITAEAIIELNRQIFFPSVYWGVNKLFGDTEKSRQDIENIDLLVVQPVFSYIDEYRNNGIEYLQSLFGDVFESDKLDV